MSQTRVDLYPSRRASGLSPHAGSAQHNGSTSTRTPTSPRTDGHEYNRQVAGAQAVQTNGNIGETGPNSSNHIYNDQRVDEKGTQFNGNMASDVALGLLKRHEN
jgi:hypothetical protein